MSSTRQPRYDSTLSFNRKNRRSTSDIPSVSKEGRKWTLAAFTSSKKSTGSDVNAFPGSIPSFVDSVITTDLHQLNKYTLKIKNAARNVHHVDSAWNEYIKHREKCFEYCRTLMARLSQERESSMVSPTTIVPSRENSQRGLSFDSLPLVTVPSSTQSSGGRIEFPLRPTPYNEPYYKALSEWEAAVKLLSDTLRSSLQETYNEYYDEATPEGFEKLCRDRNARPATIYHMRNASISKMMSADLDFFPRWDVRFRNYDEINKDLAKVKSLLGTSGIPQSRTIIELPISSKGDVILEFANEESDDHPVLRFRVSSQCLRETPSPIFGHMFNAHFRAELDDDARRSLPPPPDRYVCTDGQEVDRYRMPQTELNAEGSFEILLHAAHNHNDEVPREVHFEKFVAIAETCLRYRCTSPLELAVEHRWLPCWRNKATDDMLAGVMLIAFVFGLAENFARLSRIVILTMPGPDSFMQGYPCWPRRVEEKIVAVRHAKFEQIYKQCRDSLNEYLCPAPRANPIPSSDDSHTNLLSGLRCPRGDRTCDAQNLGWYMKSLAELGLLSAVLSSPVLTSHPAATTPSRSQSLLEIINRLSHITSPPQSQSHGGICDFAPAFRAAIMDIYHSVLGLTLFEVSGKSGWALSSDRGSRQGTQSGSHGGRQSSEETQEQLFEIAARPRGAPEEYSRLPFAPLGGGVGGRRGNDADAGADYGDNDGDDDNDNDEEYGNGDDDVAEADGTPIEAMAPPENDDASVALRGAAPPREKFQYGQLLLFEDKRLLSDDETKYDGGVRKQLLGIGSEGHGGSGQRACQGG
ncbi:hypothetical protein F4808DRAFT_96572 [Astrocystis sublimbata]|nr:hypothetical protein F4808DRAFT_96572 [Astrocystis sublimbata]